MYKAISNIKHNGVVYTAGQSIDLSEDEAKSLIQAGVLEASTDEQPKEEKKAESPKTSEKAKSPDAPKTAETGEEAPTDRWNRTKLAEYATAHNVEFAEEATKKEILAAIQAAPKAPEKPAEGGSDETATGGASTDESSKGSEGTEDEQ